MQKYWDNEGREVVQNEDVKFTIEQNPDNVDSKSSNEHLMMRRGPRGQPAYIEEDPDEEDMHTPPQDYWKHPDAADVPHD